MSITVIKAKMMINTTAAWIGNREFRRQLEALGSLGAGVLAELEAAHDYLSEIVSRRQAAGSALREIIDRIARLDELHEDKARGLYHALDALIALAPTPAARATYTRIKQRLFPLGLRLVRTTHLDQGNAADELEAAISPELRERLAALRVGDQTLEQVLDEWICAAEALSQALAHREQLAHNSTELAKADVRAGRKRWLHAIRGLLWLIELRPELASLRESIEPALSLAVDVSQRQRDQAA